MKSIKIKRIEIENFRGVANGTYNFNCEDVELKAKRGGGKSTSYYAYLWCLGFAIPKWEPVIDSYRLYKIKTNVKLLLNIDNIEYEINRINTPKYKRDKFTGIEEYSGTSFEYSIDGQPMTLTEFKAKLEELFGVDYMTLELVSNLSLFNADRTSWTWKERRNYLFKLLDLNTKLDNVINVEDFTSIKDYIAKGMNEVDINKILNDKKQTIQKSINANEVLIEDRNSKIQSYSSIDFEQLQNKKLELQNKIQEIASSTKDLVVDNEYNKLTSEIIELEKMHNAQKLEIDKKRYGFDDTIYAIEAKTNEISNNIKTIQIDIDMRKETLENLKTDLEIEQDVEFKHDNICPVCKQPLPQMKIEKSRLEFYAMKEKKMADIKGSISEQETTIARLENAIKGMQETIIANNEKLKQLKDEKSKLVCNNDLINEIIIKKSKLDELKQKQDNSSANAILEIYQHEYEQCLLKLAKKDEMSKLIEEVNNIKKDTRQLAIDESFIFQQEQELKKYKECKMQLINKAVNERFNGVKFNLAKWLSSNASKEYEDCCTCVMDGTEYDALSSGEKVVADLLVNSSLRKILNINIPQFVDDVTLMGGVYKSSNEWQTINLITDENAGDLKGIIKIKNRYTLQDCDVKKEI